MYYETVLIVNPDVSQENTHALTDELVAKVEKAGGRIVKREYWGSRALAYPIAKRKRGHYVLLVTDGEASASAALDEALRLEDRVLRFLTTRLNELSDESSPLLRRQEERARREREQAAEAEEKPAEEKASEGEAAKPEAAAGDAGA